ncbi:MAG: FAD-dependent oxidoreductase, partial [Planctomycetota bacterium]
MSITTSFRRLLAAYLLTSLLLANTNTSAAENATYDVVVYGGTSAGIATAIQVKRMGGSVVVIEPTNRIGGLTTGGLGQTDIGNKAAIGGVSREFYARVRKHYDDETNWRWQAKQDYRSDGQSITRANEETMWTFEPSAALSILQDWVAELDIPVVTGQRLDRTPLGDDTKRVVGVEMNGARIVAMTMESGDRFAGKRFVDATYEGDLLA